MFTKATALAVLAALATAAPTEEQAQCGGGHIIGIRGSLGPGEPCTGHSVLGGPKSLPEIIGAVKDKYKDVSSEGIKYPAAVDGQCNTDYVGSRRTGIQHTRAAINARVKKCGNKANIVLLGYSQGAHIISELLTGGGETGEAALDSAGRKALNAVVMIADPAIVPGASYNVGKTDGQPSFTTYNAQKLEAISKKTVSYCAQGDAYCDSAEPVDGVHEAEVDTWHTQATKFIEKRVK